MKLNQLLNSQEIHAKNAQLIARLARDAGEQPIRVASPRPAGDERTLRGIPAIGRNVGGAIPGTRPDVR